MAGGFRISESGDSRVSELGDSRITEELIFASCSLSSTAGGLILTEAGDTRVDEEGTPRSSQDYEANLIIASASLILDVAASLVSGSSSITAGEVAQVDFANLVAEGSMSAEPTASLVGSLSETATGSIVANPDVIRNASSSFTSSSSISSDFFFIFGGLFTADPEDEYPRETEAGDTRITEDNDVRIVADVLPNAAEGTISATLTYIAFSSTAYVKYNGEWTQFTPTVNNNGTWEDPLAIYKKIDSQNWKRAY